MTSDDQPQASLPSKHSGLDQGQPIPKAISWTQPYEGRFKPREYELSKELHERERTLYEIKLNATLADHEKQYDDAIHQLIHPTGIPGVAIVGDSVEPYRELSAHERVQRLADAYVNLLRVFREVVQPPAPTDPSTTKPTP